MRTRLAFLTVWLLAAPAGADWLVTLEGRLIETDGPWAVETETVVYRAPDGDCREIPLAEVDLEGSEETTMLRTGRGPAEARAGERLRTADGQLRRLDAPPPPSPQPPRSSATAQI